MAQFNISDLLKNIKKDDSAVEDNNLPNVQGFSFPTLQDLVNPSTFAPTPKSVLAKADPAQDLTSLYNDAKDKNDTSSINFLNSMISSFPASTSQPKMAEEMETPVAPAASPAAPVSSVKKAFQTTQSPEQKQAAQAVADQQNPLVDTEMESALEAARANRTAANQNSMFADLSNAIIGQSGSYNKDNRLKFLDQNIASADKPLEDVNTERDAYKKFLANKEEMEKADPNSPVSKTMRDALSGMGVKIPANASYATMENLAPQLMKNKEFQMRMQEMDLRRQELNQNKEAQKSLKADQQIAKTRDSVLKSERYKNLAASTEAIQGARSNLELARKGYSQGYSALGANLAKLAGEKGMLSEADVNRYLVAKGVPGKLESGKLELTGKPTKQQIDALEQIVNSLESDVRKKGVQFAEDELAGYSQGLNVTPEQIESVLPELKRLKAGATAQPKTNKPKTIIQNGHTYTLNESTGEYE